MTAKTTRILKEARPLLWPWCGVILAGVLPLVQPSHAIAEISPFVWFFGISLLAALSLGNEFQHRTLSLLLAQPVDRMEIWGEKAGTTAVAVISAALVFFLGWRIAGLPLDPWESMAAVAYIIAIGAAAPFWTMVARSTLGGVVLGFLFPGFMVVVWANLPERVREVRYPFLPATNAAVAIAAFVFLGYTGVMIWLGRRKLARFQVTGGMAAGDDLLMAGPRMMPGAWTGWLRCRPTGAVLNLVRKELRLLRPLWMISLLGLMGWICLPIFGYTIERGSAPAVIMVVAFTPLVAVLAGSLSLGEERTSGTHAWHLTQPVSVLRLWFIKLFMALFAGLVCAALLPILVLLTGRFLFRPHFLFMDVPAGVAWGLMVLLLSLAAFWCACAVNGTVRAVLWVFPVMGAVALAAEFGGWVAPKLMDLVVARFDLFTNFRFTNAVSNMHLFAISVPPKLLVVLLLAPVLLLAVMQSYQLFRIQLQDNTLLVRRYLLPLVIVAFLCIFSVAALDGLARQAGQQMWTMFQETHEAIEKAQAVAAKLDATHPLQLTVEDLAKAAPLSERTQDWLRHASISVASNEPHIGDLYCCRGNSRGITFAPDKAYSWYLATIHRPSGPDCTVWFWGGHGGGILGGVCE